MIDGLRIESAGISCGDQNEEKWSAGICRTGKKYEELFLAAGVPSSSWCASGRQIMSICPCPWPWAVVYLAAAYTRRTAETHSQTMLLLWGSMFILSLVLGLAIFIKFLLLGYA